MIRTYINRKQEVDPKSVSWKNSTHFDILYVSLFQLVFTDATNSYLLRTRTEGKDFLKNYTVPITPDRISFHPTQADTFLVYSEAERKVCNFLPLAIFWSLHCVLTPILYCGKLNFFVVCGNVQCLLSHILLSFLSFKVGSHQWLWFHLERSRPECKPSLLLGCTWCWSRSKYNPHGGAGLRNRYLYCGQLPPRPSYW